VSTVDTVAVVAAALVTGFVCLALLARTRHVPPTTRLPIALAVAAGLCALITVVVVPVALTGAGQGDPLGAPATMLEVGVGALARPLTLIVTVLAADVGFALGWVRMRRARRDER